LNLYRQEADQYIQFVEIDSEIDKDKAADKPDKFKYSSWNKWEESVYIYLDSIVGKNDAPLSYVIRKDLEEGTEYDKLDRKVQQIHTAPLQGFTFNLEPLYEEEKLRLLFSKSQNAHPEFKQEIVIYRSKCSTFSSAVIYMKTIVARLFPDVVKTKSRRNVSSSKTNKEINGVEISDLSRCYDSSEIKNLNELCVGRRVLAMIMGDRKHHQRHKDKIDRIKSDKRRRVKSVQVTPAIDSSKLSDRDRKMVADMINGVNNASKHDS